MFCLFFVGFRCIRLDVMRRLDGWVGVYAEERGDAVRDRDKIGKHFERRHGFIFTMVHMDAVRLAQLSNFPPVSDGSNAYTIEHTLAHTHTDTLNTKNSFLV